MKKLITIAALTMSIAAHSQTRPVITYTNVVSANGKTINLTPTVIARLRKMNIKTVNQALDMRCSIKYNATADLIISLLTK